MKVEAGEDMEEIMTEGKEAGEEGKEVLEEGMEVLHGQAQATDLLLQSRVGEEATADLAVEEVVGTLPQSRTGVAEAGLEARLCPRTILCS